MTSHKQDPSKWRAQTRSIHVGGDMRSPYGENSEALYLTSAYVYETPEEAEKRFLGEAEGFVYSRYGNPTTKMFEDRLCLMEGAESCLSMSSGMAAVNAVFMSLLQAGDHVVASRALFGASLYLLDVLLPRFGVETTLVDGNDLQAWRDAMRPDTRLVFLETPTNPTLELVDIAQVAAIAHEGGALLAVDNVFATPVLQQPLQLGADIVLYSATKHIDGQGRCLGGAVLGTEDYIQGPLREFLRQTGPTLSPFNAWVMLKGLETLSLRVRQHCDNAERIADFLSTQGGISRVMYPGLADHPQHALCQQQMSAGGPMVSFEVEGGKQQAFTFMKGLQIIGICNNLGDTKSLITHPVTTTHQRLSDEERERLGIHPSLLRLSVGLEDVDDLIEDMEQALAGM